MSVMSATAGEQRPGSVARTFDILEAVAARGGATAKQIADVTGAGDTVIATMTLALAAGGSPLEAALLANYAGGLVVMKRGTATVGADELKQAIRNDRG